MSDLTPRPGPSATPAPPPAVVTALPDVAVVICAYTDKRWDDVRSAIAGLGIQSVPPAQVILVIDHNPALLERCRAELDQPVGPGGPLVEVVANAGVKGASGSRNTGVAHVTADVIAFLDDDATPEPSWVERLLAPYLDPAVEAVGGTALPVWPTGGRPDQLTGELNWIVGCTYTGQPTEQAVVRNLMGCNMSVRREAFDAIGGFDETTGRVGTIPLGCEETELCIRLLQRRPDARIVFEPAALVHHRVTSQRTTWAYLRSRSLAEGLSKATMAGTVGTKDATSTERDYVRRVLTAGVRRELGRGLRGNAAGWRGAGGIVTALGFTTWGYARGRLGLSSRLARSASQSRAEQ